MDWINIKQLFYQEKVVLAMKIYLSKYKKIYISK